MEEKYEGYVLWYVGQGFRAYFHRNTSNLLVEADQKTGNGHQPLFFEDIPEIDGSIIFHNDDAKIFLLFTKKSLLSVFFGNPWRFFQIVFACYFHEKIRLNFVLKYHLLMKDFTKVFEEPVRTKALQLLQFHRT